MRIGIVGSGVSGIFCAIELINQGFDGEIVMYDKGKSLDERRCFVDANTPCKKCKVCSITHGVGGAGSYSDSKLNFDTSGRVGGDMAELMTEEEITKYLKRTYEIYQQFGIEEFQSKAYGKEYTDEAKKIIEIINKNPKLDLSDNITLHLGSENSRIIYGRMVDFLRKNGVEIRHNTEVVDIDMVNKTIGSKWKCANKYSLYEDCIDYEEFDKIVVAIGRSGNKLVKQICDDNGIKYKNGEVQIGCRIETTNEIMKKLNDNFYELKTYFTSSFGDKCRTFCVNPGGFVTIESYPYDDKKLFCANGHSFKNKKSNNTNFAILVARKFNEDMNDPLTNYVYPLTLAVNSLGNGSVIIQSLKDIKLKRRSTEERIKELNITPTAKAYAGDLSSAMPYRTLQSILEFIEELDKTIIPGINGDDTLLYGLEVKLCSNKVIIDKYGKSSNKNLYFIGDGCGYCRGLSTACSQGILCATDILREAKM